MSPRCQNSNCISEPHPWCGYCFPSQEKPLPCEICKNPSKGGRKLCCGRAICQQCFHKETNCTCSICAKVFVQYLDILGEDYVWKKVKSDGTGGYIRQLETDDPMYKGNCRTREFRPRAAKLKKW